MIVPTANYPTSRDYGRLWDLAHTAAIVCIVDMDPGRPGTCRDIASTTHSPDYSPNLVQVDSRGIGHVWAESLEAFIAQCEHCNLEWLVPPAPASSSEALAEPILAHPGFAGCHDGPAAPPAPEPRKGSGDLRSEEVRQQDHESCRSLGHCPDSEICWMDELPCSHYENLTAPPAQEPGGVGELVSLLKSAGRWATSTGVHLDRFAALFDQQQAELAALRGVPVAVSERPWEREEWCDEQGRCWLGSVGSRNNDPGWVYRKPHEILHQTISLPHNAISLPAPQAGEVEA